MEFGLILLIIIVVVLASGIKIIPQSKAMVVERLGAYHRTMQTGLHYVIPIFEKVVSIVFTFSSSMPISTAILRSVVANVLKLQSGNKSPSVLYNNLASSSFVNPVPFWGCVIK